MRLAAAARCGAGQLLQPGVAQLSTNAPTTSLWRQALAAAAAALGGTPAAGGSAAKAAAPLPASAAPPAQAGVLDSRPQQDAMQQQRQQKQEVQEQQEPKGVRLDAWRRGAESGGARRRRREREDASSDGPQTSVDDRSRRSSRRGRRLDKQWGPEAIAAAAGQQPGASEAGTGGGSNGSGSNKAANRGRSSSRSGTDARPSGGRAVEKAELKDTMEAVDLDAREACNSSGSSSACPLPPARILQDDAHPIRETDISRAAWLVLSRLRAAGEALHASAAASARLGI